MTERNEADTVQLSKIRMKEGLRAKIEHEARARGKTMNAVIVDRLELSFRDDAVLAAIERLRTDIARRDEPDWEAAAREICDRYGVEVSCPL